MQDFMKVTGMVIGAFPQGEYDRRIVLLTREYGKITAFVKGARRQGSRFTATTDLFAYGEFSLYVGKTSYNIQDAVISNYFEFLRKDLDASLYGMFFLELCDYYAREGVDESMLLLVLYRCLQGLKAPSLDNDLVMAVFEIKTYITEGELIPPEKLGINDEEILKVAAFLRSTAVEGLFRFSVSAEGKSLLKELARKERSRLVDVKLNTLKLIEPSHFQGEGGTAKP